MGPPPSAKALNQPGPLRKKAALLAVIPLELLIIFVFQTQHIHWLITALLITMPLLGPAAHSHILPLEVGYGKGSMSFLPKISSSYIFAERNYMTFILILEEYPELLVSVNTG